MKFEKTETPWATTPDDSIIIVAKDEAFHESLKLLLDDVQNDNSRIVCLLNENSKLLSEALSDISDRQNTATIGPLTNSNLKELHNLGMKEGYDWLIKQSIRMRPDIILTEDLANELTPSNYSNDAAKNEEAECYDLPLMGFVALTGQSYAMAVAGNTVGAVMRSIYETIQKAGPQEYKRIRVMLYINGERLAVTL